MSRRIVMLVDNDVERDSRVQKQAVSAAQAGFDVLLLGASRDAKEHCWQLDGVTVRLVPIPVTRLAQEAAAPSLLTWGAYRSMPLAKARLQAVEAEIADQVLKRPTPSALLRGKRKFVKVRARQTQARRDRANDANRLRARLRTNWLRLRRGDRAWRWLDPSLLGLELAMGPAIDAFQPDLIHANDFRTLGVAARAKARAESRGRRLPVVWDAHEYLPGIRTWRTSPFWHEAQLMHEREFAPYADRVMTVSRPLASLLVRDHALDQDPIVVMNCPLPPTSVGPSLRQQIALADDKFLLVYSGAIAPQRGLDTVLEGLVHLPEVTLALVVGRPESKNVQALLRRAVSLGVADQVRVAPYVTFDQVARYLSSADVGLIPLHHVPNHEIALITKYFEYAQARLPIVVSDVEEMARQTRCTGQGEVFEAGNTESFVEAVRRIQREPKTYRAAYTDTLLRQWSWHGQAEILVATYRELLVEASLGEVAPGPRKRFSAGRSK